MQSDRVIKTAFLISLMGHCLFLGMPGINIISHQDKQPEDVVVRIEIEKPPLLPDIDVMGEEKKLKEMVKEEQLPEPEPEKQIKEVMAEKPEPAKDIVDPVRNFALTDSKIDISNGVEVIDPQDEEIFRYQDMVKRKIQESRRYPPWAKKQEFEGISYLVFILLPNGMVRDVRIVHSSGVDILDKEAIATVKRASPFKPIPDKFNCSNLTMEVALVFKLK